MLLLAMGPWLLVLPATLVAMVFGLPPDVAFAIALGIATACAAALAAIWQAREGK